MIRSRPHGLLLSLLLLTCCSPVRYVYQHSAYNVQTGPAIKRISVAAWAAPTLPGLAEVISHVATDLIKLRKNYLVHNTLALKQAWPEGCAEGIEGVFAVRALESETRASDVFLRLTAELYRCQDGALVWRADADKTVSSNDSSLTLLTANYADALGPSAKGYAAPAFVLLQQIVAQLPDPQLSDADIEEKIELGCIMSRGP